MKTAETVLIVSALAAAAVLVMWPRQAAAAPARRDLLSPGVGGQAGDLWDQATEAVYWGNRLQQGW
jgi:hypothetical protein